CFFFQAEDGIRYFHVTGVQTCALPIYAFKSGEYIEEGPNTFEVLKMGHIEKGGGLRKSPKKDYVPRAEKLGRWVLSKDDIVMARSEERRVGKECREWG